MYIPFIVSILFVLVTTSLAGFSNIQATTINGIPNNNDFDTGSFTKIGQKYYYVEDQKKLSWFGAAHVCRQLSGHLAFIESAEEMDALSTYLVHKGYTRDHWFWIAGNDLAKEGSFASIATGNPLSFTRWSGGQPDNAGGNENCVHLWRQTNGFEMNDWICTQQAFYICQADNPRTIAFTVW